jgi:hypothetical protein
MGFAKRRNLQDPLRLIASGLGFGGMLIAGWKIRPQSAGPWF